MKFIIANWKLYLTMRESAVLAGRVVKALPKPRSHVVLCPSALALGVARAVLRKTPYALGAQDIGMAAEGAYTGEISPADLRRIGCRYVIVGHSERRHLLGESNEVVRKKLESALAAGLNPILCVGETLAERRAGKTKTTIRRQLTSALKKLPVTRYPLPVTIAYEPVWAIGTGQPATPRAAVQMHKFVRAEAVRLLHQKIKVRVIYGGSVDRKNILSFLNEEEVEGVLVGGASAKSSFIDILRLVK